MKAIPRKWPLLIAVVIIGDVNSSLVAAKVVDLTPPEGAIFSETAVSLSDLLDGPITSLTVFDKVLDAFDYGATGDMPQAAAVSVRGFHQPDDSWGLSLQGNFIDQPGGGASDAVFNFTVHVDPAFRTEGWRIAGTGLAIEGALVGDESFVTVDQSIVGHPETLSAFLSTIGNGENAQLTDMALFGSLLTQYRVTIDAVLFAAADSPLPARLIAFNASNVQFEIPPGSYSAADIDGDGDVDAIDLAEWQVGFGADAYGDVDGDHDSDAADFLFWQQEFGFVSPDVGSASVPEPPMLLALPLAAAFVVRPLRRSRPAPG